MDYEENMVEQTEAAAEEESFENADVVEEEEDTSESLDSLMNGEGTESAEEQEPEQKGTTEPGYVQKRIDKALARERESMRAEIMAQVEAQYAPIKERLLEMDAQELVRKGEVKNIELAKEILRYRQGLPTQDKPAETAERPRQANGQFAPKEDAKVTARINFLAEQANKIKTKTGIDVIEIMNSDPTIKNKIVSGEMDFYEVAETVKQKPSRRGPPAPTRSSNGAGGQSPNAIDSMSKEQFARLEKRISEGARISLK
jgi:hypothetical protein